MRLDHLLSKEKILLVCFVTGGCWLVPGGGKFFCCRAWVLRVVASFFRWETPRVCACVVCACGVVGVDEAKAFAVFRPSWLEGLSKVCLCFGFDGLFCCLACCWVSGATQGCCSIESPLCIGRTYLVGCCLLGWCVV